MKNFELTLGSLSAGYALSALTFRHYDAAIIFSMIAAVAFFGAWVCKDRDRQVVCVQIRKRSSDYHCRLAGDAKVWDCGKTPDEAIGRWMTTHGADFGINVFPDLTPPGCDD